MPELADLPQTPAGFPPTGTDVYLMGRPPAPNAPVGTPMIPFGVPGATLGASFRPVYIVASSGSSQGSATPLLLGVNVVTMGMGAVRLPAVPGSCLVVAQSGDQDVYPPANGIINSLSENALAIVSNGAQLEFHSADGVHWYA